jgi:hypothetical protein
MVSLTGPSGCQNWNVIDLTDVGKTMCVYGTVREAWIDYQQQTFFMTFGSGYDDFYMLTYGGWYFDDVENHCVKGYGKIAKIGSAPVMVVDELYHCD